MSKFTIRIKPFEGESLSSFMLRFSKANRIKFLTFWNMMKKSDATYAQMSHLYLLNYTTLHTLDCSKLADATGLNEKDIFDMTLYNILKKFSINDNFNKSRLLINMVRDEKFYYCPLCLKEKLFHRLIWNLTDVKICLKHRINLDCICPNCGEILMQKHIIECGKCPNCLQKLVNVSCKDAHSEDEYKHQTFIHNSIHYLLSPTNIRFEPQELAQKLIFILNGKKIDLNRELISKNISDSKLVPTLLQHARGTISQERTIHLKFILSLLKDKRMTIKELYELKVPQRFISSLLAKPEKYMEEKFCKAPWCKNYHVNNSLIKIPTTYHIKHNGDFKSYYSICTECGCEYVLIGEGRITERTNYINTFNRIKNLNMAEISLTELAEYCNVSKDRMIRFIAYFSSNNILESLERYCNIRIDNMLINKFIEEIKNGSRIEDVRNKRLWKNNYHYLIHRYNSKVMHEIAMSHSIRNNNPNLEGKQKIVKEVLRDLHENNVNITINTVCKSLGITHETIRLWRCNEIIQDMKKIQKK